MKKVYLVTLEGDFFRERKFEVPWVKFCHDFHYTTSLPRILLISDLFLSPTFPQLIVSEREREITVCMCACECEHLCVCTLMCVSKREREKVSYGKRQADEPIE